MARPSGISKAARRFRFAVSAAIGARLAMVAASSAARLARSAAGRTSVTSPQRSAVAASMGSPVSSMTAALPGPMLCASSADIPPPPIQPSLISGAANVAVSRGQPDVAAQRQFQAAAQRVPVHRGDDRLAQRPDRVAVVRAVAELPGGRVVVQPGDVAAGAERAPGAGEDDRAHLRVVVQPGHVAGQRVGHGRGERVELGGPVDGEHGDVVVHVQPHLTRDWIHGVPVPSPGSGHQRVAHSGCSAVSASARAPSTISRIAASAFRW